MPYLKGALNLEKDPLFPVIGQKCCGAQCFSRNELTKIVYTHARAVTTSPDGHWKLGWDMTSFYMF